MKSDARLLAGIPVVAAIVDAGTFAGAGQALGLTQSGVSRAIQRLEERLGARLFERNSQVMRLTETGQRFCQEVIPQMARLQEAAEATVTGTTAVRGRLRINLDATFARTVLVPRLAAFLSAYPALELDLVIRDQLGDLIGDGFDAAIRFGEPEPSSLLARRLLQVRVLTCASPAFLEAHGRPASPRELSDPRYPCLLFRDSVTGAPFPWEFHQGKKVITVPVAGRIILNDPLTYTESCLAGLGIAQLFELGVESLLQSGALINLFPRHSDERFPLYAYHPSRHFIPAKLRVFLDYIAAISQPSSKVEPPRAQSGRAKATV
jgi:DNA-binding transcriptional LysR family regulator